MATIDLTTLSLQELTELYMRIYGYSRPIAEFYASITLGIRKGDVIKTSKEQELSDAEKEV